jgi:hypothetical protein
MTPFKGAQAIMNILRNNHLMWSYPFTQQAFITVCNAFETTNSEATIGDVIKFLKELDRLGYKISYK